MSPTSFLVSQPTLFVSQPGFLVSPLGILVSQDRFVVSQRPFLVSQTRFVVSQVSVIVSLRWIVVSQTGFLVSQKPPVAAQRRVLCLLDARSVPSLAFLVSHQQDEGSTAARSGARQAAASMNSARAARRNVICRVIARCGREPLPSRHSMQRRHRDVLHGRRAADPAPSSAPR